MDKRLFKRTEWVTEIEVNGAECHDRTDYTGGSPIDCLTSSHDASSLLVSKERPGGFPKCDRWKTNTSRIVREIACGFYGNFFNKARERVKDWLAQAPDRRYVRQWKRS